MTTGEVIALIKALGGSGGGSGGGGVLVVNLTESEANGTTVLTCDKTAGEMAAALESGSIMIHKAVVEDGETGHFYYPLKVATVAPDLYYSFTAELPIGSLTAASASEYPSSGDK